MKRFGMILVLGGVVAAAAAPMHAVAHTVIGGAGTTVPRTITRSDSYTLLGTATLQFAATPSDLLHECAVTATAQVSIPSTAVPDNKYVFVIGVDTLAQPELSPSARVIEHRVDQTPGDDFAITIPVSVTQTFFKLVSGTHQIFFLGKKSAATPGATDAAVTASNFSFVCGTSFPSIAPTAE